MAKSIKTFLSQFISKSKDTEDELLHTDSPKPDRNSLNPNQAWKVRKFQQSYKTLTPVDVAKPCDKGSVRFVCISDTHTQLEKEGDNGLTIPDGDVLLHAGDFTMYGTPDEVALVNSYLGRLPHKYKIIIAGNHDVTFDLDLIYKVRATRIWSLNKENYESRLEAYGVKTVHELLTNAIYLQDSMVRVFGMNIYGAPWQPGSGKWGFNRYRGLEILEKWNKIPEETDILLTHGPPCGYGDDVGGGILQRVFDPRSKSTDQPKSSRYSNHVGCVDLLNTIQTRVRPKYHVFGHIHEGYGMSTDGVTTFINASTCDENYRPVNPPLVFDVPVKNTKSLNKDCPSEEFEWLIKTVIPGTECCDSDTSTKSESDDDSLCFTDRKEGDLADSIDDVCFTDSDGDDTVSKEGTCFTDGKEGDLADSIDGVCFRDSDGDDTVSKEGTCFTDRKEGDLADSRDGVCFTDSDGDDTVSKEGTCFTDRKEPHQTIIEDSQTVSIDSLCTTDSKKPHHTVNINSACYTDRKEAYLTDSNKCMCFTDRKEPNDTVSEENLSLTHKKEPQLSVSEDKLCSTGVKYSEVEPTASHE